MAAMVYMDNTTWIALSKSNMQKILDEAAIFYKANNSQVNGKKSVLIAINASKNATNNTVFIGPNKETLKKTEENEFVRYLGVWIGERDYKNFIIGLLQWEIAQITHALSSKKTTDKQILYILNRVLISRIEYRTQHCFLTKMNAKSIQQNIWESLKTLLIYQVHVRIV